MFGKPMACAVIALTCLLPSCSHKSAPPVPYGSNPADITDKLSPGVPVLGDSGESGLTRFTAGMFADDIASISPLPKYLVIPRRCAPNDSEVSIVYGDPLTETVTRTIVIGRTDYRGSPGGQNWTTITLDYDALKDVPVLPAPGTVRMSGEPITSDALNELVPPPTPVEGPSHPNIQTESRTPPTLPSDRKAPEKQAPTLKKEPERRSVPTSEVPLPEDRPKDAAKMCWLSSGHDSVVCGVAEPGENNEQVCAAVDRAVSASDIGALSWLVTAPSTGLVVGPVIAVDYGAVCTETISRELKLAGLRMAS
jgi:hypothetical protein